jgi:hypothetical protein
MYRVCRAVSNSTKETLPRCLYALMHSPAGTDLTSIGHCTPTMYSTSGLPWGGQCIEGAPQTSTICTVGDNRPCNTGSTCTPTMTCTSGIACGGDCIATPTPPPALTSCTVGNNRPCGGGSTCTPTMTCTLHQPCGGACIATPTPTGKSCLHGKCERGFRCVGGYCVKNGN